ncbi:MAG: hypothetical protein KAH04_04790, partial [Psychrilyobacter sp.]|nr:hypothetical protein [Psychrilyobacter sp.]
NYRSEKKIIDFVNTFFLSISQNQEVKDEVDRWEYNEVKCCKKEDEGFVAVMVDPEIHMAIAVDIEERFGGKEDGTTPNYKGIGVVARKKSDLSLIGEELKARNIPFIMDNSLSIVEHRCVKEIISLLNYFIHNDYMSLVEFFRRTIGIGEEDLKYLLENRKTIEVHMGSRVEVERVTKGDSVIENIIKKEIEEELDIIKKIRTFDSRVLGEEILKKYNLLEKYSAPRDIKNINFFLELMENYEYLNEFIEYLDGNSENLKQVGVTELNSVILMTIHGSKGLDFHTEYMHISDKQKSYQLIGYDDGVTKHQVQLLTKLDEKYECIEDYLFTNSIYSHVIKDSEVYSHNEQIYLDEMLNTFYVGMTRPRANLIVSIEPTKSSETDKVTKEKKVIYKLKNDLLISPIEKFFDITREKLLEGATQTVGKFIPYLDKENIVEEKTYSIDPKIYHDAVSKKANMNILVEKKEDKKGITSNVENELKRKMGLAIHYYLENIEYGGDNEK